MHTWAEKNFDWKGLDEAITYIATNLIKWGRVNVRDYKEKFGTCRIYCSLGWSNLLSITHPRHVWYPYPKWLVYLDIYYFSRIIPFLFNWFIVPYHKHLYRKLYKEAVNKYPHLKEEILCCADYSELLKGL